MIKRKVIRRIATVATAVAALMSFAMTALAAGRPTRRPHPAAHAQLQSAQPDQVIQWNQELQKVLVAPGAQPASIHPTRTMAIAQIAVYDAVNGIVGGGRPFLVDLRAPRRASSQAAAAAAARTALDALLPSQQPTIDAFFQHLPLSARVGTIGARGRQLRRSRRGRCPRGPSQRRSGPHAPGVQSREPAPGSTSSHRRRSRPRHSPRHPTSRRSCSRARAASGRRRRRH